MEPVIKTHNLTKRYGPHTAVNGLNLEVPEGCIFGFLGPNGAGKTTTLLMLLGLTEPSEGTAQVLGADPVRDPLEVKRHVGYLPENMGFYRDMTARENLQYVAELNAIPKDALPGRIEAALTSVGLSDVADKLTETFSRGMRQRLGIAEVLIKEPRAVFLDEPTLGLDPDGITKMLDLIVSLSRERGITVVLSSHLLHQVQRICDTVGIMVAGELRAHGSIEELTETLRADGFEGSTLEDIYMRYFREE